MKILSYSAFRCAAAAAAFQLAITIAVCYPCHFKDLQWNDNPLFGVMQTVIKLIPQVAAAAAARV